MKIRTKISMSTARVRRVASPTFGLLSLAFGLLLQVSCTNEALIEESTTQNGGSDDVVRLELFTNADDYSQPVSRAGQTDETTVGNTPWVFVFKDLAGDKTFVEAVQAEVIDSKSYVKLKRSNDNRKLLILANAPENFYNTSSGPNDAFNKTNVTTWLNGKTCDDAQKMLTIALATTNQTTIPYTSSVSPYPVIPMSGSVSLGRITPSTTIGTSANKVALHRIVARVTVENDADDFTLEAATVAGASRQGNLFPVTPIAAISGGVSPTVTNYLTTTTGDGITGIAAATSTTGVETTIDSPIYIYESVAGQASLIVKGKYKGSTYYYKHAFKHADQTEQMAVERNYRYHFTIISVEKEGYTTVSEAITAPPSNIRARIEVTELSSHDIIDNGQYYLGVSNSEFIAYSDMEIPTGDQVIAVTVSTNATSGITTNSVETSTTGGGSFSITQTSLNLSTGSTNIGVTELFITLPVTFTTSSEGTITIKLGNLTKTIKVTRKLALEYGATATEFSATEKFSTGIVTSQGTGSDWLSLSFDGVVSAEAINHPYTAGKIYLMAKKNSVIVSSARKGGEVYLSRHSEKGRIKLYVNEIEIGENCYIVAPNSSVEIPVARANASELGTQLEPTESFTTDLVWTNKPHTYSPIKGTGSNGAIASVGLKGSGSHAYIIVNTGPVTGNAVVAIKKDTKILWSWHIWVDSYNPEASTYISNGKTFMQRNLGAHNNTKAYNNLEAFGMIYQWGRKDPFPGSGSTTTINVEPTNYYTENSNFAVSKVLLPVGTTAPNYNLVNAIANPGTFYYSTDSSGYDWYHETSHPLYLWGKDIDKSIYDPCPEGWRVPTSGAGTLSCWYGLTISPTENQGMLDSSGNYYPFAGCRSGTSGNFYDPVAKSCFYWSATNASGYWGYGMRYYIGYGSDFAPSIAIQRAQGCSVRCVKIQ